MKKTALILLSISILEGGALMATELIGAKLAAPFYGTSLYVWATIFAVTLGGLALGYLLGGYFSNKNPSVAFLRKVLLAGAVFTLIMPFWGRFVMGLMLDLPLIAGVLISCALFLMPSLICFGMVSPLVIQLLDNLNNDPGKNSGTVYAISTLGGVACTFAFGFYFIPFSGITLSLVIVSILMLLGFLLSLTLKPAAHVN